MLVKTAVAYIVLLCLCVTQVFGQQSSYPFSRLDISQGLSHNRITSIYKDHMGFMWFGTIAGLNRYDGYVFKNFVHDAQDTSSIADNYITHLYELPGKQIFVQCRDANSVYNPVTEKFIPAFKVLKSLGLPVLPINCIVKAGNSFWFLYSNGSLLKLDENNKVYTVINQAPGGNRTITSIAAGTGNNLLAVHSNGLVDNIDVVTNKITFTRNNLQPLLNGRAYNFTLFADKQDGVWVYEPTMPTGVFYYDITKGAVKALTKENGLLNNNIVSGIVQDVHSKIWIGTDHGGINIIDKNNFSVEYLKNKEDDNTTLSQNVITALYNDSSGIIWAGTYKRGINYCHEDKTRFTLYRHLLTDKNSLSYDDVNRFVEDDKHNLWIGTNGGGLIYFNRQANTFTQYRHDAGNSNSISNDVIVSLYITRDKKLWIGSYFGGLDCFDGNKFTHYKHDDKNPASITEDRIWEIYEDGELNLWVGTFNGGLDKLNRTNNNFQHFKKELGQLSSNYISSIIEDARGNLWVGTDAGINVLQKNNNKLIRYSAANSGLVNDDVISLFRDKENSIWIGSRNGLSVYNSANNTFQSFSTRDGLPDNSVLNILQDNNGKIWISTPGGISKITFASNAGKIKIHCNNYDEMDGLQGRDFNENAAYKTAAGEIVFGGANGFNIFNPALLRENKYVPPVVFTDFQLFNKSIAVGQQTNKHTILPQAINGVKNITLKYNENVFSIEFAALSFDNTEKNKYAYKLDGFDNQWLTAGAKNRRATYTNLDPGTYTFHVKASNDNGIWNEKGADITITVLPPFWRTTFAYIFYVLLTLAIIVLARRALIKRAHARFALAQERREAQRVHALDLLKIKFFTNVSHEFRTPLSLILAPLDKIIRNTQETEQKKQLQLIQRNGRRMLNLVNQLLDFRKMEVKELKLSLQQGNLARFIKETCYSFTDIAETKQIQFNYNSNKENCIALFDTDKLERILFNLLSNAFKFTPEKGSVSVDVEITVADNIANTIIKVIDTGIGIPKEKTELIFDRFFQDEMPVNILNQGSGIGLAITKEFVRLYDGAITVESEVDKGSCFIVELSLKAVTDVTANIEINMAVPAESDSDTTTIMPETKKLKAGGIKEKNYQRKKPVVLLVDDNSDFLFYLKDNLKEFYNIAEAGNGKDGWQQILSSHPDLVVSDVNMPVMSGIELCKKIKADARTRHIPVILLTALAGEDAQVTGLETGATDYITKPFNFEIMLSKIRNILSEQTSAKKAYSKRIDVTAPKTETEGENEKFMRKAFEIVEKNIANPNFSVEELSRDLHMSRVGVYKKIFSITGSAPIDYIKSIRLQRAAQLLVKTNKSVAEIAYEVGFNNPKYFSKFFKAAYNVTPSEYADSVKEEQST